MARGGRFAFRILLAGAIAGSAYLAWISSVGSPAPVDLLPRGAAAVVEARDVEALARRLAGTRFATDFAKSQTRSWLERTATVQAFDSLRADIGRITGWKPGRDVAFDLLGAECAAGWYPQADGPDDPGTWIVAGRLSVRAWAVASALRIARVLGLGAARVQSAVASGQTVYSLPADAGGSWHLFMSGRMLVASSSRAFLLKAAGVKQGGESSVTSEPAWRSIRESLRSGGECFVWSRGPSTLLWSRAGGAAAREAPFGAVLRAGKEIEIDMAADSATLGLTRPGGTADPLPAVALLRQSPLFFFSSTGQVPQAFADLLASRRRQVSPRGDGAAGPIGLGRGYALAITGSAGTGLLPAPRGIVIVGMASAAEAADVLPALFPAGARTAAASGTRALATRESFPLAGGFDLWGSALGRRLVFATDLSLIDAVATDTGTATPEQPTAASPGWRVQEIGVLSVEQALPLLRRWAAPISGLLAAKWPDAPDLTGDIELLATVRAVRVTVGSDDRLQRAAVALTLRDRP